MALLLATVAATGTIMGTQYVSAWHHGHHGHGGYTSAMASGGGGGSMPSSGGTPSSGGGGGGCGY